MARRRLVATLAFATALCTMALLVGLLHCRRVQKLS